MYDGALLQAPFTFHLPLLGPRFGKSALTPSSTGRLLSEELSCRRACKLKWCLSAVAFLLFSLHPHPWSSALWRPCPPAGSRRLSSCAHAHLFLDAADPASNKACDLRSCACTFRSGVGGDPLWRSSSGSLDTDLFNKKNSGSYDTGFFEEKNVIFEWQFGQSRWGWVKTRQCGWPRSIGVSVVGSFDGRVGSTTI